jgi:hypothetical protein
MSSGAHDIFVFVNFPLVQGEPKHVTIRLFEVVDTYGAIMAPDALPNSLKDSNVSLSERQRKKEESRCAP